MALEAKGKKFCKITHTENGRTLTRRIHLMTVQDSNGVLHHLQGEDLPDSMMFYSGVPYTGAHTAEVLLSPGKAKAIPLRATNTDWLGKRDLVFVCVGIFLFKLIVLLAHSAATALS